MIIWPEGKLIFAVSAFFLCLLYSAAILHCFRSLLGPLTPTANTHQTELTFNESWKSGLGLSPRFKLFWRGVRASKIKTLPNWHCRGWPSSATVHVCKHATYSTSFLKTKKNSIPDYSLENLISDGTFATPWRGERWEARLSQGQKTGHKRPDLISSTINVWIIEVIIL